MSLTYWLVTNSIKNLLRVMCQVDAAELAKVPEKGPLLLVCNHVNFLEVPLVYTHLAPRPVTGFAKAETWDNPLMAQLFNLWGAIPVRRGEVDTTAIHRGVQFLRDGNILAVAPEGTRSGDGRLQRGHAGIVTLAQHSQAPILPLVYYGGEAFWENIKRLQRTGFHIRVGRPFQLRLNGSPARLVRQKIVDEVMYQLATLLPAEYRGDYADLSLASTEYLDFVER
jgi:1-acyl-sn-glycerol-3-phosphate acyltransferase